MHSILVSVNSHYSSPFLEGLKHPRIQDYLSKPSLLVANNLSASRRRVSTHCAKKYKLQHCVNRLHINLQQTSVYLQNTSTSYFALSTQDISVGTATRIRAGQFGVRFVAQARYFPLLYHIHRFRGPPSLLFDGFRGSFSWRKAEAK
jgi:hypothetical protein